MSLRTARRRRRCCCGPTPCSTTTACVGTSTLPMLWRLDATAIGGTATAGTCADNICAKYARVYAFAWKTRVAAYAFGGLGCTIDPGPGWVGVNYDIGQGCYWLPIFSRRRVAGRPPITESGLENAFPLLRLPDCDDPFADCSNQCAPEGVCPLDPSTDQVPVIELELQNVAPDFIDEVRIHLFFSDAATSPSPLQAHYYSPWTPDPEDYSLSPLTVTLDSASDSVCDWPATLTLEPNGSLRLANAVSGCASGDCSPTFGDGDFGILRVSGTLSVAFTLCMSRDFDDTDPDAVPSWSGATTGGLALSCGAKTLALTLYCDAGSWKLKVRNNTDDTEDIYSVEVTVDGNGDIDLLVSETVTAFCGESLAFVASITACAANDLPFAACKTDPASLCCMGETIAATGHITYVDDTCTSNECSVSATTLGVSNGNLMCGGSPLVITGWDPTHPYLIGDLPLHTVSGYPFSGRKLLMWCDGSTMQAKTLKSDNCIDDEGNVSSVTWDPDTFTGEVILDYPFLDCCDIGSVDVVKVIIG